MAKHKSSRRSLSSSLDSNRPKSCIRPTIFIFCAGTGFGVLVAIFFCLHHSIFLGIQNKHIDKINSDLDSKATDRMVRQLQDRTERLQQCEADLKDERILALKVRATHHAAIAELNNKFHLAQTTIAELQHLPPPPTTPPPPPPPQPQPPPQSQTEPKIIKSSSIASPLPLTSILSSSSSSNKAWLTIGLPTVPRSGGVDYLTPTITSFLEQISDNTADPLYGKVRIVIMNMRPGEHPLFEKVRSKVLKSDKGRAHVFFVENNNPGLDATPNKKDRGTPDLPGYKVRKQTRDLVSLLRSKAIMKKSEYYLFSEDDMRLCDHGIIALRYLINRATFYRKDWLAIRVSYGMNGILMRNNDVSIYE
jgi:hypothetical protein